MPILNDGSHTRGKIFNYNKEYMAILQTSKIRNLNIIILNNLCIF